MSELKGLLKTLQKIDVFRQPYPLLGRPFAWQRRLRLI